MKTFEQAMKFNFKFNCRVCLERTDSSISIFAESKDEYKIIANKIAECAGIEIDNDNSEFPDKICQKCMNFLTVAGKFRTCCRNTDNLLQSLLNDSKVVVIENEPLTDEQNTNEELTDNALKVIQYTDDDGQITFHAEFKTEAIEEEDNVEMEVCHENEKSNDFLVFENTESDEYYQVENEDDNSNKSKIINPKENITKLSIENLGNTLDSNLIGDYYSDNNISDEKDEEIDNKQNVLKSIEKSSLLSLTTTTRTTSSSSSSSSTIEPQFICEICGNKYKKKNLLESHMRWHNTHKEHKCEICNREFTMNFQLTRHMRIHTGVKPYSCSICNRKFSDNSTCTRHFRTHTGERPYSCNVCRKSFTYSNVLKAHMVVHTGEKPFVCDKCGKTFSRPHHLKAHLSTLAYQSNNCSNLPKSGI